jgi:hypothetical protein
MTEKMWETAIRQRNHFIKPLPPHYQRNKWFLIGGPWFDILNVKSDYSVILSRYLDFRNDIPGPDCRPPLTTDIIGDTEAYWEKYRLKLSYFKVMITDPDKFPRLGENMIFERNSLALVKYLIVDAWQCNGGILPVDLRCPYWDDRLPEIVEYYQNRNA